jgi:hypothetical protein
MNGTHSNTSLSVSRKDHKPSTTREIIQNGQDDSMLDASVWLEQRLEFVAMKKSE